MPSHKTNKYGRDFKAHLKVRNDTIISKKTPKPLSNVAIAAITAELEQRKAQARLARASGTAFPFPFGGSYDIVAAANKEVRGDLYLEANHSPPCDAYVGTPYEATWAYGARPAHAMLFYHHRAPSGSTGGLTSTGGSSFNKPWAEQLRPLLQAGDFAGAMALDFNDILATTTPNRAFYALALHRCALYARYVGLIDEAGLNKVLLVYSQYLTGDDFGIAHKDADEAS